MAEIIDLARVRSARLGAGQDPAPARRDDIPPAGWQPVREFASVCIEKARDSMANEPASAAGMLRMAAGELERLVAKNLENEANERASAIRTAKRRLAREARK